MKLSLHILEYWFRKQNFVTSSRIIEGQANLVSFQISSVPLSSNIGRICPASLLPDEADNHSSTAIVSGSEYLLIHNSTQDETLKIAFQAYEYYHSWESSLYQKITATTSLQELLEMTAGIFNRPMSICNSRGWDYAMTGGEGPYIHPLREDFQTGSSNDDSTVTDRQTFLKQLDAVNPIVIYSAAHKCNVLVANIWLDGEQSGAILAYETEIPFSVCDHQIMTVFQNIITVYATIHKGILRSRSALSEYLIDILDQKPDRNYDISKILKYPNWKISDQYIILCAASRKPTDSIYLNRLCDELELSPYKPQTFIYDNMVVALINMKNSMGREYLLSGIRQLISEDLFCWGISHEFYGIMQFADYYPQARHALQEAMDENLPGKTMRDTAIRFIREHTIQDPQLQTLLHPDVIFLINYDKQNHTLYANTLYWFLLYSCNYTDAANHLNLHRNTLIYRISRIEGLISANISDIAEREFLLLSFMLCREQPATEKY